MDVKVLRTAGIDIALQWMRFSFNSSSKGFIYTELRDSTVVYADDIALAENLIRNGDSHAKFTRFIYAWLEINAPRYFWQEFDQYKFTIPCIPPDTLSESTVHTIATGHLRQKDFEGEMIPKDYLEMLNELVDKKDVKTLKKLLPESFLQTRGICLNYQTIRHIWQDRKNHKLQEWHTLIDKLEDELPLFKELILERDK